MSSCLLTFETEAASSLGFRTLLGYNKKWNANTFGIFFYL